MPRSRTIRLLAVSVLLSAVLVHPAVVPTDVQMPGTQPLEVSADNAVSNCDNCHGGYDAAIEPSHNWRGSMMAHAARDPLFWAALAVAEQDFAGSGDLCLRCHTPRGWLEGRSVATDGSAMTAADADGLECAICHKLTNPDQSEHLGVQNPPFVANDGGSPVEGYYGSGMLVMWGGRERLGPYADSVARHEVLQSRFHRSPDFCGTCHDVSNPLVGDVAPGNGAQLPLPPGSFSGQFGGAVEGKAAFNNPPYAYGVVERTYSEFKASAFPTLRVRDYGTLPAELQDGALRAAHAAAMASTPTGDYVDGAPRFFTCQTCHMPPILGKGCNKSDAWDRPDLPLHDLTGGNYWVPDLLRHLDARGKLRLGGGLDAMQLAALEDGKVRARRQLDLSAKLSIDGELLRVVNLTGHKLISGYPEGRRMWLSLQWLDDRGELVREDGAYGPVDARIDGVPVRVDTLLDPTGANTRIYQTKMGITQEWAARLLAAGLPAALPLAYDRNGATTLTLGELAALPPGSSRETFHFVLNNTTIEDTRIPPYGMRYDDARTRNILPVPGGQYGNPGPGGVFDYWDELTLAPPPQAAVARIVLRYQPTSWEYVQFLDLANHRSSTFLGNVGRDLLDGWLATGMAAPHTMATAYWCGLKGTGDDLVLETEVNNGGERALCQKPAVGGDRLRIAFSSPSGVFHGAPCVLMLQAHATGSPPPPFALPGFQIGRIDIQVPVAALPPGGVAVGVTVPAGVAGATARFQVLLLSPSSANGLYATSSAHDFLLR